MPHEPCTLLACSRVVLSTLQRGETPARCMPPSPSTRGDPTFSSCRSFEPILRLLPQGISPVSQHWATWALYNLVSVYREYPRALSADLSSGSLQSRQGALGQLVPVSVPQLHPPASVGHSTMAGPGRIARAGLAGETAQPRIPGSVPNASCFHVSEQSKISMPSVRQSKTRPKNSPEETDTQENERT